MKLHGQSGLVAALLGASAVLAACSDGGGAPSYETAALETNDQKASYGIGMNVGAQIAAARERIDREAFMRGVEDGLQGNEPQIAEAEMQTVLQSFGSEIEAAAAEERTREGQQNLEEGEAFLTQNALEDGVRTTDSGLQYEVLREGDGPVPGPESTVRLHYRGTLIDGTEFDSSYDGEPAVFTVGGVIDGFSEAIQMMPVGSQWRVTIPSDLAYGAGGSGPIGPNETLIFELELLEIVDG
ncbi:MAG TPA: FKBP-type peptidyl-prolyl cis-trans isomerase [Longimicrobiales bacterium]|nr:FKBP-type peptidyl-prolyl cis-trans isomerase [Longimicrobiales bacterium]